MLLGTFGQAVEKYLAAKSRKRSANEDRRILGHLSTFFGKETPLADITASRISEYKAARLSGVRTIGKGETASERRLSTATVNRALALLRHLLRLAHEEWAVFDVVPRVRMEREAEGRLPWLTPEDATRLHLRSAVARLDTTLPASASAQEGLVQEALLSK